ncbi:MAG: hypothetical protein WCW31_02470 [Patescibacteria group bacterium]
MNKLIGFGIIMFGVITLSGCGTAGVVQNNDQANNPAQGTSVSQTDTNTVKPTAAASKITAIVPEGWLPVEGSVLPVQYMKGSASFMAKTESFGTTDLDQVTEKALAIFKSAFSNVSVQGETTRITVDGHDARKLVFTSEISGIKMKYMYVYTVVGNDVYAITFGDQAESYDSYISDYEKILNQIKFVN